MKTLKLIIVAFALMSSTLMGAKRDLILFKSGKQVEILITKEDGKEIRFKDLQTGASQKVSVDEIDTILYEDAPPTYKDAVANLKAGRPDAALQGFVTVKKRGLPDTRLPWIESYVSFYTAKSLALWGRATNGEKTPKLLANAKSQLTKFEGAFSSSRFIPESIYLRGMCELKAGNYDAGRKIMNVLSRNGDRPYWASKAQAGIGESYLLEKDYDKAESHCLSQLKAGRFSGEIVEILSQILIDRKMDGKKAFAIGKKLLGRGDRDVQKAANELVGASSILMKNYEGGLMALLRSRFMYGDGQVRSSRSNIYTALAIKQLMASKPKDYPDWDYNSKFASLYRGFRSSEQKIFSKILKTLK